MMHRIVYLFVFLALLRPDLTIASVRISEIAWMGTTASANNEWIELWNDGAEQVNLTGWTIKWAETGTSPKVIALSGSIAGEGYYLLERTDDDSVPGITADLIYVGALGNSGEKLVLYNGAIVSDVVDASGGWPAGDNTTKDTMQLVGGSFQTFTPSPKAAPSVSAVVKTTAPVDNKDKATTTTDAKTTVGSPASQSSSHSSPWPLSDKDDPLFFQISAGRNRLATVESPLLFDGHAWMGKNELPTGVTYRWSFGDGDIAVGKSVRHTYMFPGNYVIVLNAEQGNLEAVARSKVRVTPFTIDLSTSSFGNEERIMITNSGKDELNLGRWKLVGVFEKIFPEDTIIEGKSTLTFRTGRSLDATIATTTEVLISPNGKEMKKISFVSPDIIKTVAGTMTGQPIATTTLADMKQVLVGMEANLRQLLAVRKSTTKEKVSPGSTPKDSSGEKIVTMTDTTTNDARLLSKKTEEGSLEPTAKQVTTTRSYVLPKAKQTPSLWRRILFGNM